MDKKNKEELKITLFNYVAEDLKDKDLKKRIDCAILLGKKKDPIAVDVLTDALRDDDWEVRHAAAEALGKIRHLRAVGYLRENFVDERVWPVREAITEALLEILEDSHFPKVTIALCGVRYDMSPYEREVIAKDAADVYRRELDSARARSKGSTSQLSANEIKDLTGPMQTNSKLKRGLSKQVRPRIRSKKRRVR